MTDPSDPSDPSDPLGPASGASVPSGPSDLALQPDAPAGGLSADELARLRDAKRALESQSFVMSVAELLDQPLERATRLVPEAWQERISRATHAALLRGLDVAVRTLGRSERPARPWVDRALAASSGAAGGAFGLAALPVELPISTTIILRAIAEAARAQGADLERLDVRLACLEVLALGGRAPGRAAGEGAGEAAETGYWASRAALAQVVHDATRHIATHGLARQNAPALVRLVNAVAARFGVVVGEGLLARALPVVGAAGGATVNWLFLEHFQRTAAAHFAIRALEERHGSEAVRAAYERIEALPPSR